MLVAAIVVVGSTAPPQCDGAVSSLVEATTLDLVDDFARTGENPLGIGVAIVLRGIGPVAAPCATRRSAATALFRARVAWIRWCVPDQRLAGVTPRNVEARTLRVA